MPRPAGYVVSPEGRDKIAAAQRQRHKNNEADLAFARALRLAAQAGSIDTVYALVAEFIREPDAIAKAVREARVEAAEGIACLIDQAIKQGVTIPMLRADLDRILSEHNPG